MCEKKSNVLFVICIIMDILAVTVLFFIYGPINHFRDLWVTTAMSTQSHQYLARIFYSEKTIQKILSRNYIQEINENTNTDNININDVKPVVYINEYEEQILKKDPNNNDYKIININGTNSLGTPYKGYVVAIYDPSRVELAIAKKIGVIGQKLTTIVKENNALIGINASGFEDPNEEGMGGQPTGIVIKDGKIIYNGRNDGGVIVGFNYDNILVITKDTAKKAIENGMKDGMQFGPALMINGKSALVNGNGGLGIQPRTVLAQRQDGIVLFVVIDGRQLGYSVGIEAKELIIILENYGAYNAVNMDGGASSTLVVNGELYNKPCGRSETGDRWLPNGWVLK